MGVVAVVNKCCNCGSTDGVRKYFKSLEKPLCARCANKIGIKPLMRHTPAKTKENVLACGMIMDYGTDDYGKFVSIRVKDITHISLSQKVRVVEDG